MMKNKINVYNGVVTNKHVAVIRALTVTDVEKRNL